MIKAKNVKAGDRVYVPNPNVPLPFDSFGIQESEPWAWGREDSEAYARSDARKLSRRVVTFTYVFVTDPTRTENTWIGYGRTKLVEHIDWFT